MNNFQWIAIPALAAVLLWDVRALVRAEGPSRLHLARIGLWSLAIVCIWRPDLTSLAAQALGIDRGADLIAYGFHFAFLATTLYFYSRYLQLRATLTEVVRHLAIREAELGQAHRAEP